MFRLNVFCVVVSNTFTINNPEKIIICLFIIWLLFFFFILQFLFRDGPKTEWLRSKKWKKNSKSDCGSSSERDSLRR